MTLLQHNGVKLAIVFLIVHLLFFQHFDGTSISVAELVRETEDVEKEIVEKKILLDKLVC